jgi:large subunit ribosomal protein L21e
MVQKSYGKMRGTRKKLAGGRRPGVTAYLKQFKEGDMVHINLLSSSPIQHPHFDGKTGRIVERRGRNYVVEIREGSVLKKVFMRPEHLKIQKAIVSTKAKK